MVLYYQKGLQYRIEADQVDRIASCKHEGYLNFVLIPSRPSSQQ